MKEYCRKNGFKHLIIVTDNSHTRRALYAFKKVFQGSAVRIEAMGAPNHIYNEQNWWKTDSGISAYLLEGVKYIVYLLNDKNPSFVRNY